MNPSVTDFVIDLEGWKLVPKDEERQLVLQEAHDDPQSGHLGTQELICASPSNIIGLGIIGT